MGYRDDAFWELPQSEQASVNFNNNGTFKYPSKNIRFLAAQEQLHPIPGVKSNDYKLTRGYIRGLTQKGIHSDTFKPLRCNFQFNPQQIVQSVAMREDVYLPILQDPTQFSQPFAGSVNFNFDLLFDRSMEVSQGTLQGSATTTDLFDENYWESQDIGVMADLQVLYAVIGQGFSKSTMDFQRSRLEDAVNREVTSTANDLNESPELTRDQVATSTSSFVAEDNLGNAAFLIPNPVRVIFSSLFMVDGFVTGTHVDFLKFSTNMVPLQARVSISMNAIYVGFAKEKTFLTEQLENAADTLANSIKEEESKKNEILNMLQKFKRIDFFTAWKYQSTPGGTPIYEWAFDNDTTTREEWRRGAYFFDYHEEIDDFSSPVTSEFPIDYFKRIGADISLTWNLKIYGTYNTKVLADAAITNNTLSSSTLRGMYNGYIPSLVNVQRFEEPNSGWSGDLSPFKGKAAYVEGLSALNNTAPSSFKYADVSNTELDDKYYVVKFQASLVASFESQSQTPIKSFTEKAVSIIGSEPGIVSLPLTWLA